MKIAILQLNPTVGNIKNNKDKIVSAVKKLPKSGIDLIITSELMLIGYPPKDLLLNPNYIKETNSYISELAKELKKYPPILVGSITENKSKAGKSLYNSAVLIKNGKVENIFSKTLLPNYDIFDESRYFEFNTKSEILKISSKNIGISICEDIWNSSLIENTETYHQNPIESMTKNKLDLLINISASPFTTKKQQKRTAILKKIATKYNTPIIYVNQVGGNDDLIFDGKSCAFDQKGNLIAEAKSFEEDVIILDLNKNQKISDTPTQIESNVWNALVLGTRDYIQKCGFKAAVIGLSGGIDSALTAAIAVEAIGKENILGLLMPSPYSSQGSIDDALDLAKNLGIKTETIPIEPMMKAYTDSLKNYFAKKDADTTEENIQARIRGNLLMAFSNKYRSILLTTGNKSELAVGYCTIYGDMCGGLAVISDVPKTLVFSLSKWLNKTRDKEVIPINTITKPPSAELKPDQKDQDSLPPYEILDEILFNLVECHKSKHELIKMGFDTTTINKIAKLVHISEFKRKQAAPGLKITDRAFGSGWRMPIAANKAIW